MTALDTRPAPSTRKETEPRPGRFTRRRKLIFGGIVVLLVMVVLAITANGAKTTPPPATPAAAPALTAHGAIEPVSQATVATINGGVVRTLAVRVGQEVGEQQKIAEISGATQTEVLVAPWAGTIMGLNVHRGDTVMPGAVVATLGDLSRFQVRSTDVDEYLIGQIRPGQEVTLSVEALDGRKLAGVVETVSLAKQASSAGVFNYPVVIRLSGADADLRPGMSVRIVFSPPGGPS